MKRRRLLQEFGSVGRRDAGEEAIAKGPGFNRERAEAVGVPRRHGSPGVSGRGAFLRDW